jgi:hypothetical protein
MEEAYLGISRVLDELEKTLCSVSPAYELPNSYITAASLGTRGIRDGCLLLRRTHVTVCLDQTIRATVVGLEMRHLVQLNNKDPTFDSRPMTLRSRKIVLAVKGSKVGPKNSYSMLEKTNVQEQPKPLTVVDILYHYSSMVNTACEKNLYGRYILCMGRPTL